jgi:hypothetical protein
MHCYVCAEQNVEQPAVALCRSCSGGLCLEHLRETAVRFASDHILSTCHHDTWTAIDSRREQDATTLPAMRPPSLHATADGDRMTLARRIRVRRSPHRG